MRRPRDDGREENENNAVAVADADDREDDGAGAHERDNQDLGVNNLDNDTIID